MKKESAVCKLYSRVLFLYVGGVHLYRKAEESRGLVSRRRVVWRWKEVTGSEKAVLYNKRHKMQKQGSLLFGTRQKNGRQKRQRGRSGGHFIMKAPDGGCEAGGDGSDGSQTSDGQAGKSAGCAEGGMESADTGGGCESMKNRGSQLS